MVYRTVLIMLVGLVMNLLSVGVSQIAAQEGDRIPSCSEDEIVSISEILQELDGDFTDLTVVHDFQMRWWDEMVPSLPECALAIEVSLLVGRVVDEVLIALALDEAGQDELASIHLERSALISMNLNDTVSQFSDLISSPIVLGSGTATSQRWEIEVTEALQLNQLEGPSVTFTPESGNTFLVMNITINNLMPSEAEGEYLVSNLEVVSDDGESFPIYALGFQMGEQVLFATLGDAGAFNMATNIEEMTVFLAFSVKEESINESFEVQAQGIPPVAFSIE